MYTNTNLFFITLFTLLVPRWLTPPFAALIRRCARIGRAVRRRRASQRRRELGRGGALDPDALGGAGNPDLDRRGMKA